MLGRLTVIFVAACILASSAFAAATDPKKRHNAADQAWAKAIRIQRDDLGGGDWRVETSGAKGGTPKGCKDPNLSDLVETGSAERPDFSRNGSFVGSGASIFQKASQATAAWQRLASAPITDCIVTGFKRAFSGAGVRVTVLSEEPLAFGKVTQHVAAGRVRVRVAGPTVSFEGRVSFYLYAQGRATAILMVSSFSKPLTPIAASLERRLAQLVAARMHK
jgi:hypothetical protein